MKKVALTLASVVAAAAFAPEASAIPSFARQTGMACSACHQQHYPILNGFGQAFKAAGYTMMGSQEKVEGEHLSIPATLNGSMLLKARYQTSTTTNAATDPVDGMTTNSGQWQIPDEFSLFFGGRVADAGALKAGFMFEGNTAASPLVAGFKMPVVVDLDSAKILVVPYLTDALGAAYGFDQSSTGMTRGVRWAEHRKDISAMQYTGVMSGAASGLAFAAVTDMGYINVSKWTPEFAYLPGATGIQMGSSLVRVAATPTVADWALQVGGAVMGGKHLTDPWNGSTADEKTEATMLDFQAFGALGGNDLGIYSTYTSVPKATKYNGSATDALSAMTIGADYSVIQHTLHVGAAYLNATRGSNFKHSSITGTVVYDLTQNIAVHVNHSMRSGDAADAGSVEKSLTTFLLEAAW